MFQFNANGHLVPADRIVSSLAEIRSQFVEKAGGGERRGFLLMQYCRYTVDLMEALQVQRLRQWIDGSFVTKKLNPSDIDFLTFLDPEFGSVGAEVLERFRGRSCQSYYGREVDAYLLPVLPSGHPREFLYQSDRVYWLDQFTQTRHRDGQGKKMLKGFVEIDVILEEVKTLWNELAPNGKAA